jgi:pantoate--beta-alanine ligase
MSVEKVTIARDVASLRDTVADWRRGGARVALVPTMGALHRGHMSLVAAARQQADRVVLSIFVNPTQFAPSEDFDAYPRTFDADLALFSEIGGGCVYAPTVAAMYGAGFATSITPGGPATAGLEDAFRPTHFAGVATVVAKLILQCGPDVALFGEKDWQQLKVISRTAVDLDLPVRIAGVPTLRDADGLAMSSRNVYLTPSERETAPRLHEALHDLAAAVARGDEASAARSRTCDALAAAGFDVDYVEVRDAESLGPPAGGLRRVLAAARLGRTRLIDNVAVPR